MSSKRLYEKMRELLLKHHIKLLVFPGRRNQSDGKSKLIIEKGHHPG